jgi:23S rRNA (guanosine2251-2'-O)-methyltransferase
VPSRLILNGIRSIEECLLRNPERISKILITSGKLSPRLETIKRLAIEKKIRIETNPQIHSEDPVVAILKEYEYTDFENWIEGLKADIENKSRCVVLALDGITDSNNLGAILRTAAFMGVSGVLIPKDRAASINDAVYRIASGGLEYLRVCQVTNLVSSLKRLKEIGMWSVGFSENANQDITEISNDFNPIIVIGNEERGMRHLTKENCDYLVKFESKTGLQSLNASVAAGLAMAWAVNYFQAK